MRFGTRISNHEPTALAFYNHFKIQPSTLLSSYFLLNIVRCNINFNCNKSGYPQPCPLAEKPANQTVSICLPPQRLKMTWQAEDTFAADAAKRRIGPRLFTPRFEEGSAQAQKPNGTHTGPRHLLFDMAVTMPKMRTNAKGRRSMKRRLASSASRLERAGRQPRKTNTPQH